MGIFGKKNRYYIKLYINRIEIKNLVNKKSISENSQTEFNNLRLLVADFMKAKTFIRNV